MAVKHVLSGLSRNFQAAIVIIQHVDERFAPGMAEWLSRESPVQVRVAKEGDRPAAEPPCSPAPMTISCSKPRIGSVTRRAARATLSSVRGCLFREYQHVLVRRSRRRLLTGMGRDGAKGLKSLRAKGHYTIAQDEATSAVYGMPKAAATLGAAVDILPLPRIAVETSRHFQSLRRDAIVLAREMNMPHQTVAAPIRRFDPRRLHRDGPARRRPSNDRRSRASGPDRRTEHRFSLLLGPFAGNSARRVDLTDSHSAGSRHAEFRRSCARARIPRPHGNA